MLLTVVEFEPTLDTETSSAIETGKEPDDRQTVVRAVTSVGLVRLVHEWVLPMVEEELQAVVVN